MKACRDGLLTGAYLRFLRSWPINLKRCLPLGGKMQTWLSRIIGRLENSRSGCHAISFRVIRVINSYFTENKGYCDPFLRLNCTNMGSLLYKGVYSPAHVRKQCLARSWRERFLTTLPTTFSRTFFQINSVLTVHRIYKDISCICSLWTYRIRTDLQFFIFFMFLTKLKGRKNVVKLCELLLFDDRRR